MQVKPKLEESREAYIKKLKAKAERLSNEMKESSHQLKKIENLMKKYGVNNITELEDLIKKD